MIRKHVALLVGLGLLIFPEPVFAGMMRLEGFLLGLLMIFVPLLCVGLLVALGVKAAILAQLGKRRRLLWRVAAWELVIFLFAAFVYVVYETQARPGPVFDFTRFALTVLLVHPVVAVFQNMRLFPQEGDETQNPTGLLNRIISAISLGFVTPICALVALASSKLFFH
jgi:hypothetical protein